MRALRCVLACQPSWLDRKKRDATRYVRTRCVMPIGNCDWGLNALQIRQVSACTSLVLAVKQCLRVLPLVLNSARKGNRLAIVLPLCCPSTCRGEIGGTRHVYGRLQRHRLECHCTVAI